MTIKRMKESANKTNPFGLRAWNRRTPFCGENRKMGRQDTIVGNSLRKIRGYAGEPENRLATLLDSQRKWTKYYVGVTLNPNEIS